MDDLYEPSFVERMLEFFDPFLVLIPRTLEFVTGGQTHWLPWAAALVFPVFYIVVEINRCIFGACTRRSALILYGGLNFFVFVVLHAMTRADGLGDERIILSLLRDGFAGGMVLLVPAWAFVFVLTWLESIIWSKEGPSKQW